MLVLANILSAGAGLTALETAAGRFFIGKRHEIIYYEKDIASYFDRHHGIPFYRLMLRQKRCPGSSN